jgi:hypothetical protein
MTVSHALADGPSSHPACDDEEGNRWRLEGEIVIDHR